MDILKKIYDVIENRAKNPKDESYTNYLLNKGNDKICKKIGEEAAETIIAVKNKDKAEIIYEISDLFYHLLVVMYNNGVALSDIEAELAKRFKG
jgi:phosphoribosyl-ATP pyrophosphohydrolase/phosphoribosyl-AMP cyclohydrolase